MNVVEKLKEYRKSFKTHSFYNFRKNELPEYDFYRLAGNLSNVRLILKDAGFSNPTIRKIVNDLKTGLFTNEKDRS